MDRPGYKIAPLSFEIWLNRLERAFERKESDRFKMFEHTVEMFGWEPLALALRLELPTAYAVEVIPNAYPPLTKEEK